jgi:transcription elongation factor Elf1
LRSFAVGRSTILVAALNAMRLKMSVSKSLMQLESTLTCPKCSHQSVETMPTNACQFFYDCKGCGERLKPRSGDCCVFCSYGTVPCPPIQSGICRS